MAVALVVLLGVAALVVWGTSPEVATVSTPDTTPLGAPSPAGDVPAGFAEAWRAPSGATRAPVVAGPAVVTGDGGLVAGHDATSGAVAWSYRRDLALCTVAAGFPGADDGDGHALALYEGRTGWCSELTALHPSSGRRADTSNPDMRPGVQLLADGSYVTATGTDYLEVWRSDLVRTLEYGDVPTPVQPGKQPRPQCDYGSTAMSSDRIGVIERCPDAPSDRLTVITPDGSKGADTPEVQFSVELPATGAVLVALSSERAAVAVPGPPRLDGVRQGRAAAQPGAPRRARRCAAHVARRRPRHRRPPTAPASTGGRAAPPSRSTSTRSRPRGPCATPSARLPRTAPASWRPSATASSTSTPSAAPRCARCPCPPRHPPPRCASRPRARCCWSSAAPRSSWGCCPTR